MQNFGTLRQPLWGFEQRWWEKSERKRIRKEWEEKINTKNSGLAKLLRWSHAICLDHDDSNSSIVFQTPMASHSQTSPACWEWAKCHSGEGVERSRGGRLLVPLPSQPPMMTTSVLFNEFSKEGSLQKSLREIDMEFFYNSSTSVNQQLTSFCQNLHNF